MKILAVHSAYHPIQEKRSAVDAWRLARPLAELRKHVDWQIDERHTVIPHIEEYKSPDQFTEAEMQAVFADICSYDVVISSYQSNPTIYTLLQVARDRAGTQYILDVDDDMFAINPDNPVWLAVKDENIYHMQCMIRDNAYISTTTEKLASVFRDRRMGKPPESVFVNPNYINEQYHHPKFDNGDKIVIGWFGGSSHYGDLHRTGVLEAIEKIMHEHKNVYFKSVGMPIDTYLPKARFDITDAKKGDAWLNEIYPSMAMDIAIAPLEDNLFNASKSNIKWQEATRAGSLFVASNVSPYKDLPDGVALMAENNKKSWYTVLKRAVTDKKLRQQTVQHAQIALDTNYRLEDHWQHYADMFEQVVAKAKKKEVINV